MNICIFGDSIVWGAADSEKGGWVERLKIDFAEHYDAIIYNLGISGETTEELLERVEDESRVREPNIMIFAIGINDSQFIPSTNSNRISVDNFKINLEKLYNIAKKFTSKIIFVGLTLVDEVKTTPIPWDTNKTYINENIKQFDQCIKVFCSEKNLKFIEMNNVLKSEDLADGLHPNSRGHEKIFHKIKSSLEILLDIKV